MSLKCCGSCPLKNKPVLHTYHEDYLGQALAVCFLVPFSWVFPLGLWVWRTIFFFPYREEILPVTRNCKESISREKWFKRANSVFTWFQLSFKFLYSSWQKLYLLVQTSNPVDSIGHCYGFLPLDLGEEWNEMVGREDLKDFQMIGYVVKF